MTAVEAPARNGRTQVQAPAGRVRGPRRRLRLDPRLVIGVLLVAAAVAGGLRLAATGDDTVPVVVATRDLPSNHRLEPGDVTTVRLAASAAVVDTLVRGDRIASLTGRVLSRPVAAGGLLDRRYVGPTARSVREVTVPLSPEHALGGSVRVGEKVDLLASFGKGTADARTLTVASGVEVVATVREEGFLGRDGKLSALTLSVAPDDVVFVVFAARNGELDVVRATGGSGKPPARFERSDLP